MGSMAGFSAFNGTPGMMTSGSNLGIGPSSLMAGGFNPNLNFAAGSGMSGGFNTSAFAQGNLGSGGFNNGFGTGAMDGLTAGPSVWNDGFDNGFRMGVMAAQYNGLGSRNDRNAVGNDPAEPDAAALKAARAGNSTNATTLRMRATAKPSKARAKTTRKASRSR
jgi:hypothetical protein